MITRLLFFISFIPLPLLSSEITSNSSEYYSHYTFDPVFNQIEARDKIGVTYSNQLRLTNAYKDVVRSSVRQKYHASKEMQISKIKIWNHLYDDWFHFSVELKRKSLSIEKYQSSKVGKLLLDECLRLEFGGSDVGSKCKRYNSGKYPIKIYGFINVHSKEIVRIPNFLKSGGESVEAAISVSNSQELKNKIVADIGEGVNLDPALHLNGEAMLGTASLGFNPKTGAYDETSPLYRKSFYGCLVPRMHGTVDVHKDDKKELLIFSVNGFDSIGGVYDGMADYSSIGIYLSIIGIDEEHSKFKVWLNEELVGIQEYYRGDESPRFRNEGGIEGKGEYREARFFFKDVDENGVLDVVVWRRFYDLKYNDWNVEASFNRNQYYIFEESSYGFIAGDERKIKEKELEWNDGFPSNLGCDRPFSRFYEGS